MRARKKEIPKDGERHLSWKCFWRSAIASCTLAVVAFVVATSIVHSSTGAVLKLDIWFPIAFLMFVLLSNVLPDYLSLLETRFLLSLMTRRHSPWLWAALILLDAALTAYIGAVGLFTAITVGPTSESGWVRGSISGSFRLLGMYAVHPVQIIKAAASMPQFVLYYTALFYAAFFTSIWLWLYAGAGFLLKAARRFDIGFQWFNRRFDIEKKPLQSIGFAAGALVAVAYWAAVIVSRVV